MYKLAIALEKLGHKHIFSFRLDLGVYFSFSLIGITSNTAYLYCFAKGMTGLNKVSQYLTTLNEELHYILPSCGFISIKYQTRGSHLKVHLGIISLIVVDVIASGMMTFSWSNILFKQYSENLPVWEMVTFFISFVMNNLSCIYPAMAISADVVLCCLLGETEQVFRMFNWMLTAQNRYSQAHKSLGRTSNYSQLGDQNNILTVR